MTRLRILLVSFVVLVSSVAYASHRGARAAGVLLRFGGDESSELARYDREAFETVDLPISTDGRRIENRVYRPRGASRGAIVLVHGMHRDGHLEGRLVALAKSFAAAGVEVWTPRIESLASFSLRTEAIDDVRIAASSMATARGVDAVPVFGISFAGGIALIAASDRVAGASIASVVTLGAHDDLARVARWFAGDEASGPNGESVSVRPHPYGAQLFLGEDPARFFGAENETVVRELIGLVLRDDWRTARARSSELSPHGRVVLENAIAGRLDETTRSELRAMIDERSRDLAALSPHALVRDLRIPVLILHGAEDPIVPATEARHLATALPDATVLVTSALRHAENADDASLEEKLALVRFVDQVLRLAADADG